MSTLLGFEIENKEITTTEFSLCCFFITFGLSCLTAILILFKYLPYIFNISMIGSLDIIFMIVTIGILIYLSKKYRVYKGAQ